MKLLLVVLTFATSLLSIQCRPQAVQIEKQVIRWLPEARSLEPLLSNQRGSVEETDRILREIERINIAMGYKKKPDVAFPRSDQGIDGAGYFYPRPPYFPPSLVQLKVAQQPQKTSKGISAHPFRAQSFFYPTPYLQLPTMASPRAFQFVPVGTFQPPVAVQLMRSGKELRQSSPIYVLPISVPAPDGKSSEIRYIPSTINFGSWGAVQLRGKALDLDGSEAKRAGGAKKPKGVMEEVAEVADAVQSTKLEEELLEEIVEAVDYDEEDDERKGVGASGDAALANDKFMGGPPKASAETEEDDDDDEAGPDVEMVMLQKVAGKSFNISTVFNNFTQRFSIHSTTPATELSTDGSDAVQDLNDLKEKPLTGEEDLPAQDKGPFGIFGTKQADAGSGLVIQRLRVRHGGIAIAGPGGVATAGSGGTAIVGPNGTAITHPRSLTIAGPGAKIYAVPETVDLANTINATKRSLPLDAVLVASGPVVYYRT
uniref:DUF4774 domain-containing protein n=1 Tax=Anopheles atroparvus TaxID=41427 RepID=A0AAG5D7G9_ANOAO